MNQDLDTNKILNFRVEHFWTCW